jgi:outer membrane receptor protein involved in Fe transport
LILTGALAGETFNPDGTLRQFQFGSVRNGPSMIGGADGWNTFDGLAVTQPYERIGTFARVSFDVTDNVKLWVDGSYMRMEASAPYFPDSDRGAVIRSDNAFLSPEIRNRLEAADQDRFTMGRWFQDRIYQLDYHRENIEGAIGIDGEFGDGWRYSAYYDHGEYSNYVAISNVRIRQNYLNAVDAVVDPATGRPVCRIALTNPSTNCVPVNLFGEGNISDAAAGYIFGAAVIDQRSKLDTGGVSLRGDPFSTWAGPVSIAVGAEARRESVFTVVDPISAVNGFVSSNRSPTIGSFNVKEGFAELVLPLLNVDASKIEFNGAVRYSDYSNSGGIWSWKAGLTDRIFDDLLLRATYSRDIRSGNMGELFTSRATNFSNIVDPVTGTTILASMFTGGNPNLKPERANTLTLGGSYAPGFVPGLNLSVDYYAIKIKDVIATISAQDTVTRCVNGNTALCNLITRNSAGAITSIEASYINLSRYETSGVDVEASYNLPLERIGLEDAGTVRLRALATYVHSLITDDGVVRIQGAGTVGDNTSFGTPKWRGTASLSYDAGDAELDLRVRYVGGGVFSRTLDVANNHIGARTYVDLGARFDAGNMTFSVDVANLFDRAPPLTTGFNPHYDVIGRYLSAGVRVNF